MNPLDKLDKADFSEAEWLNIRAAAAETFAEYEEVYDEATTKAESATGPDRDIFRQIRAVVSIHLAEFERAAEIFVENIRDGHDEEARSQALWLMAAYLPDLADECPTPLLVDALKHGGEPIDRADYLFRLAQTLGKKRTVLVDDRDAIIADFYEAVDVDLSPGIGEFLRYGAQFFGDRQRLNQAYKRGDVPPPQSFETEYWKNQAAGLVGHRSD